MPSVGIHHNVPFDSYKAWDAINIHGLMPMEISALHCRYALDNPSPSSPEMEIGSALHVATFEPGRFEKEYYLGTQIYKANTKEGKDLREEELQAAGTRTLIRKRPGDAAGSDSVAGMSASLWAYKPTATFLRMPGACEVCLLWEDPDTGLLCKARFDKLVEPHENVPAHIIVELKSTGEGRAGHYAFGKEIANFDYDAQAAYYKWGLSVLTGKQAYHVFLVAENVAPYAPSWGSLDQLSISSGAARFRRWLNAFAACKNSGQWPGYPEKVDGGAPIFTLPKWRL